MIYAHSPIHFLKRREQSPGAELASDLGQARQRTVASGQSADGRYLITPWAYRLIYSASFTQTWTDQRQTTSAYTSS